MICNVKSDGCERKRWNILCLLFELKKKNCDFISVGEKILFLQVGTDISCVCWFSFFFFFFSFFFFRKFQKCLRSRKSRSQVKRRKGRNRTKKRSHGRAQGTCTVRCKYTATSNFCVRMDSSLLCFL